MSSSGSIWDSLSGVTATSSELNLLDGDTSVGSSITIGNSDGFIVNDGGTTRLIPASDISTFVGGGGGGGDITAVTAGDGLTGGGSTGAVSLAVGAGNGIDLAADAISVDVSDFMTNGSDNRVVTATGTDAMNGEANLTFDGNTLTITDAVTDTNAGTFIAVDVNFDKTGNSTSDNTMIGINLDMDNTSATGGNNEMVGMKVTPTLTHASGTGTATCKGIEIVATGATATPQQETVRALDIIATGAETNQGIFMKVDNGTGPDIKMVSSANNADSCTIAVGANGETTITTTDGDAALAHLNLTVDGNLVSTAATAVTIQTGATGIAEGVGVGYVIAFGSEDSTDTLAAGKLMYLDSTGTWKYADADAEASTKSLIAIALGTNISDGLLTKGYFKFASSDIEGAFAKGAPCFISEAAGKIDFTSPSAAGDFVRVIGYGTDTTNVVYFNPSGDWIAL